MDRRPIYRRNMISTANKRYITAMIVLVMSASLLAQEGREERRAELEAKRIAYITEQAEITAKEAETFWPKMNELQEKKRALRDEAKPKRKERPDLESMTESEVEEILRNRQQKKVQAEQLELDYLDDFIDILGAKKLAAVHKAEKEFRRTILKEMRDNRRGEREGRPGPR